MQFVFITNEKEIFTEASALSDRIRIRGKMAHPKIRLAQQIDILADGEQVKTEITNKQLLVRSRDRRIAREREIGVWNNSLAKVQERAKIRRQHSKKHHNNIAKKNSARC